MPSVYMLAKDKVDQARFMVSGDVWHDKELAYLMDLAAERLEELAIEEIQHERDRSRALGATVTWFRAKA